MDRQTDASGGGPFPIWCNMKHNGYDENQISDGSADVSMDFSVEDIIAEVKAEESVTGISRETPESGHPIMFKDGSFPFTEAELHSDFASAPPAMEPPAQEPPAADMDAFSDASASEAERSAPGRHRRSEFARYKRGFADLKQAVMDELMPEDEEDSPPPPAEAPAAPAAEQPAPDKASMREQALSDVERIFGVTLTDEEKRSSEAAPVETAESAEETGSPQGERPVLQSADGAADPDATRRWDFSAGDAVSEAYAPAGAYQEEISEPEAAESETPGFREKVVLPVMGLFADAAAKREEKRREAQARMERERASRPPEMAPEAAAKLYADQAQSLRTRCYMASVVCLILVWLSYGLPAAGLLGSSVRICTFACLILELIVMVFGLDIFANGMRTLFQGKPGAESLIAVSCVVSALDAVYTIVTQNYVVGLPFCAASALSLTAALWGYYLSCKSFALNFLTAVRSKEPTVVLSEDGGEENGRVLVHVRRPVTGFVRSSEEADLFEKTYSYFAPILLIFALVLSLLCFVASKKCNNFPHTLASAVTVSASLSTVLGFAFPFYTLTKRLSRSGVAVAGYTGAAELGRIRRVVLKDKDLFPVRTLSLANIKVADGFYPDRVVSCTASMVAAAGLGVAPVFTDLMKKNGYAMKPIEDFTVQESGGIVARVNGDLVYVGPAAFMKLMGVSVPKGEASKTAVCTAINDTFAGAFEVNYAPVASVQRGLMTLLRGGTEPVFAVRDFNITPMLVQQKFRLPRKNYEFPSFANRYRISSDETEAEGTVAAVFPRSGLNAVAGLIRRGRKLYRSLILCDLLSVLGSFVGMILMLAMCWQGVWSSASCANAISFMLLWLVPVFVVSYGLKD